MSKNTYLPLILTEVGYGKQTEHASSGLSDIFQTTGRQGDFRTNHRWVVCNYPKKLRTKTKLKGSGRLEQKGFQQTGLKWRCGPQEQVGR